MVVVFLVGSGHANAADIQPQSTPSSIGSPAVVSESRQIPALPPDVAAQVKEVEKQIDAVLQRGEHRPDEEIQSLIQEAERVVVWRTQHQGGQWWETIDARQRLVDLQRWHELSPAARGEWAQAHSLHQQAIKQYRAGQYAVALPLAQRALAIREQVLGPTHPSIATSLSGLAMLYDAQGQYSQARPLYERALAIREEVLEPTHPDTALSLNSLALLYETQGQYAAAIPLYERALAIMERALGPTNFMTAMILNNLAMLYGAQGQYAAAMPLYERALAIMERALGPTNHGTASVLDNLAVLYDVQGQYAAALPLAQRALAIREQVLGPTHPDTALSLNNLASLYQAQGAYAQALPLYERALAIYEQTLGPNHPRTATVLANLGRLLSLYHPDTQAAEYLLRAARSTWHYLTEAFPTLSPRQQQQFLRQSAFGASDFLWHLFAALPTLDRGAGLEATLLSKQLLAEAARQESGAVRHGLADAPPAWQALWRERESLRRQYATLALQGMNDEPLRTLDTKPRASTPPQSIRQLADSIEQLEQQLRGDNPAYAAAARLQEITVTQVRAALHPGQVLLEYVQFHTVDEQTKQLAKTLHYGVYVVRGDQTPIVAIDLGEAAPIDATVRQFETAMRAAIDQFKVVTPSRGQVRKSEAALAEASAKLRALIWEPLVPHQSGVTRVYVAPEGVLSLIPFEALAHQMKKGAWQYLVEDKELVYLNTGRDLARLALTADQPASSSARTAVLIGNPAFQATPRAVAHIVAGMTPSGTMVAHSKDGEASPTLGTGQGGVGAQRFELPRTWQQVPALDHLLDRAKAQLLRARWEVHEIRHEQAVEEAVLQLQGPRILQFATHGYLLDRPKTNPTGWDNPLLRSMLLLTGVNQADPDQAVFYRMGKSLVSEAEAQERGLTLEAQARVDVGDGVLTAYEVTGMNLQGTELVNLTACETGLGEVTSDGVAGLRQAFLLAGARVLTMSMWEVPAEETTQQIEDFYQRWLGGGTAKKAKTRYAAFRQTQLAALAKARETYGGGHPFFWAGVIYIGDPGDVASAP